MLNKQSHTFFAELLT